MIRESKVMVFEMMPVRWSEVKLAAQEFKKELERETVLRRYEKWIEGEVSWQEEFLNSVVAARIQLIAAWKGIAKRALDLVGAIVGIFIFSPLMVLIAIAIRLNSKGPVFYTQTRVGLRGRLFPILKFRTMYPQAESQSGPVWAKENDPRITRVGRFLRKTHLDELPQFFNVLKGEMSLVGPRPERPYFVDEFRKSIPHYDKRLCAKPGITGLAQIKRRYDETMEDVKKKVRYDLLYIRKMCPLLDVKVITMTISEMLLRNGR